MTNIHNLPMDIWHYILEYLSLDDLVRISGAFDSTTNAAFQIQRRVIKAISDLVINGTPRAQVIIAGNGPCYKFQEKYPRAGPYRHRNDHPQNRPCGGLYNPGSFLPMRTLHRHTGDDHKMEMILYVNKDKIFGQCIEKFWPLSYPAGPAEMVSLSFRFSANPPDSNESGDLYLHFDTLPEDINDTFTDISNSLFRSTRTIIHNIPLRSVSWLVRRRKTVIPLDWLGFLGSEISAVSMFSKELVNRNPPTQEHVVKWKILSFETQWSLLCS